MTNSTKPWEEDLYQQTNVIMSNENIQGNNNAILMTMLIGAVKQMTQTTQSLQVMQDSIVTLCNTDNDDNRKEKLKQAAARVTKSKK